MAELIKANGARKSINPKNGTDFSLGELQGYVGGYIEPVCLPDGNMLVVNEEAFLSKDRKFNKAASDIAEQWGINHIFPEGKVWGDVVYCKEEQVR